MLGMMAIGIMPLRRVRVAGVPYMGVVPAVAVSRVVAVGEAPDSHDAKPHGARRQ